VLLTDSVCEYQPNDHQAQVEECETADAESQVVDAGEDQQRREHVPDPDKEGIDRHLRLVLLLGGRREAQDVSHRAVQRIVGGVLGDLGALDEFQERPGKGGEADSISFRVFVLDVDEINSADQNFTVNFYYMVSWKDPRQARDGEHRLVRDAGDVWTPMIQVMNQQKRWSTLPEIVQIEPDGTITYAQRSWTLKTRYSTFRYTTY